MNLHEILMYVCIISNAYVTDCIFSVTRVEKCPSPSQKKIPIIKQVVAKRIAINFIYAFHCVPRLYFTITTTVKFSLCFCKRPKNKVRTLYYSITVSGSEQTQIIVVFRAEFIYQSTISETSRWYRSTEILEFLEGRNCEYQNRGLDKTSTCI